MERILKYQTIESYMLQELSSGKFSEGDRFFAENDIARQFQVTAITARKAFAKLEEKQYIVRRRGCGTFVKMLPDRPQRLKILRRCIIGIVIGDLGLDNSVKIGRMLFSLYRAIENAGYLTMLASGDFKPLLEAEVNGVIVLDKISDAQLETLKRSGIPVVGMYPQGNKLPGLSYECDSAAQHIVDYLGKRGVQHLLLAGAGDDARKVQERFEFRLRHWARQQEMAFDCIIGNGDFQERLHLLFEQPRCVWPDAIFVANTWSLDGINRVLQEHRLTPGKDISILVHGSNALFIPGTPSYSILDLDLEESVSKLVSMLMQMIRDPQAELPLFEAHYAEILDRGSIVSVKK